jgi:F-type H+-transporting ATPase subunit epsilon
MSELKCIIVTPEQTVCETVGDFVALRLFDGEIGIAPGHTPLIGRLGCGELRIMEAGVAARYYVQGGFVEVLGDVVTVLTQRAVPAAELDPAVAAERLETVRTRPARTPELTAAREQIETQCRAELATARRARQAQQ